MRVYYGTDEELRFEGLTKVNEFQREVDKRYKHLWEIDVSMTDFRIRKNVEKLVNDTVRRVSRATNEKVYQGDCVDRVLAGEIEIKDLEDVIAEINTDGVQEPIRECLKLYTPMAYIESSGYYIMNDYAIVRKQDLRR